MSKGRGEDTVGPRMGAARQTSAPCRVTPSDDSPWLSRPISSSSRVPISRGDNNLGTESSSHALLVMSLYVSAGTCTWVVCSAQHSSAVCLIFLRARPLRSPPDDDFLRRVASSPERCRAFGGAPFERWEISGDGLASVPVLQHAGQNHLTCLDAGYLTASARAVGKYCMYF